MDREVAETLTYFRENISDLRKLGKEWGLTDNEIEECVQRAMSADVQGVGGSKAAVSASTTLKFKARKSWSKLRIFMISAAAVLVLFCVFALALQSKTVTHQVEQMMQPMLYPLLRTVRLLAVPLHAYLFTYDRYMEECLIDNPFFDGVYMGPDFCESCHSVEKATEFTNESLENGSPPATSFMGPILFRGRGHTVSLKKMQEILSPIPLTWRPMQGIETNLNQASQVKDLLQPGIEQNLLHHPDFYFTWISKMTSTSQLMRKVFPRPEILSGKGVSLRKAIYLGGTASQSFTLPPSPISSFSWYVQGWGTRRLLLSPTPECSEGCKPIDVTLQAGDLFTYNCELYSAEVFAAGDDISIAFLSHFL